MQSALCTRLHVDSAEFLALPPPPRPRPQASCPGPSPVCLHCSIRLHECSRTSALTEPERQGYALWVSGSELTRGLLRPKHRSKGFHTTGVQLSQLQRPMQEPESPRPANPASVSTRQCCRRFRGLLRKPMSPSMPVYDRRKWHVRPGAHPYVSLHCKDPRKRAQPSTAC